MMMPKMKLTNPVISTSGLLNEDMTLWSNSVVSEASPVTTENMAEPSKHM